MFKILKLPNKKNCFTLLILLNNCLFKYNLKKIYNNRLLRINSPWNLFYLYYFNNNNFKSNISFYRILLKMMRDEYKEEIRIKTVKPTLQKKLFARNEINFNKFIKQTAITLAFED